MSLTAIAWGALYPRSMRQYHPGVVALFDQSLVSITNFATALLIGRVCGKPELGVYTLAWTLLSMVTELSGALITTPYTVLSPQMSRVPQKPLPGQHICTSVSTCHHFRGDHRCRNSLRLLVWLGPA